MAADAQSGTSGGSGSAMKSDLGDFLEQLNLDEEEFDDLVIDADDPEINKSVRWLALARVHTKNPLAKLLSTLRCVRRGTQPSWLGFGRWDRICSWYKPLALEIGNACWIKVRGCSGICLC